ncbi:hypothetical protein [Pseudolysinimonas sp.]
MSATNSSAPQTANPEGVKNNSASSILPRRIGASVESELERELWRLTGGETTLNDYTPALQAWWVVAAEFGRQTANRGEIERLEFLVDWYAFKAANPGRNYYAHATNRLWEEAGRTGDYSDWREAVSA